MVQYSPRLDAACAALSDPTRRGILERLGRGEATVSDLAAGFDMSLTGMKKHLRVLEEAGLVTTKKVGRVRHCRLGPRRLDAETAWIAKYQQMLDERGAGPAARDAGVRRKCGRRPPAPAVPRVVAGSPSGWQN